MLSSCGGCPRRAKGENKMARTKRLKFAGRVRSRSARARAVEGVGFASHGWRLAAMLDAAA